MPAACDFSLHCPAEIKDNIQITHLHITKCIKNYLQWLEARWKVALRKHFMQNRSWKLYFILMSQFYIKVGQIEFKSFHSLHYSWGFCDSTKRTVRKIMMKIKDCLRWIITLGYPTSLSTTVPVHMWSVKIMQNVKHWTWYSKKVLHRYSYLILECNIKVIL